MTRIRTFLMFEGAAEEAMNFYVSLFPDSKVLDIKKYEEGENAGKVYQAVFKLADTDFFCIDSPIHQNFSFTPSMSIFVDFESESELERVFAALSEGGSVLMPLDRYDFSARYGWVADRFGVSWQLNLV